MEPIALNICVHIKYTQRNMHMEINNTPWPLNQSQIILWSGGKLRINREKNYTNYLMIIVAWVDVNIIELAWSSADSKISGANMGPIWGRRTQMGPILAQWTLLPASPGFVLCMVQVLCKLYRHQMMFKLVKVFLCMLTYHQNNHKLQVNSSAWDNEAPN